MNSSGKRRVVIISIIMAFFVMGFFSMNIGSRLTQSDITNKLVRGQLVIENGSLVYSERNKSTLTSQNQGNVDDVCFEKIRELNMLHDQAEQTNDEEYKNNLQDVNNERNGLYQAVNEVVVSYAKQAVLDRSNYKKISDKTDVFLKNDFETEFNDNFIDEHMKEIEDAKMIREKVLSGDVYFQEISGYGIYSAPNYFHWTRNKLESTIGVFCGGLDCEVPSIFYVDENYIYWDLTGPCSGGMRPDTAMPTEDYYRQYQCELIQNALYKFNEDVTEASITDVK